MRALTLAAAAAWAILAAGCGPHGSCCSDGDCWGTYVCSVDCAASGGPQGTCLQRCQVDPDCSGGDVCDDVHGSCACEAPSAPGAGGSCPQGANAGG
ncbi:MAG TPA: hypothetical protein VMB50_24525 [Myxococcales bacterium]|nr:hypothetical protein [Myxococcales bacterium]